ncbi:unnamed protein product [Lactuca saligna]|uniref:Uncharacterized protein n=1 Tax=Lactuca saligna TaxID=75948 RepID=A0AA35ZLN6_LACSI|nr:unnamed protein product [Lactuca saligna]
MCHKLDFKIPLKPSLIRFSTLRVDSPKMMLYDVEEDEQLENQFFCPRCYYIVEIAQTTTKITVSNEDGIRDVRKKDLYRAFTVLKDCFNQFRRVDNMWRSNTAYKDAASTYMVKLLSAKYVQNGLSVLVLVCFDISHRLLIFLWLCGPSTVSVQIYYQFNKTQLERDPQGKRAIMSFTGIQQKCKAFGKPVYPVELLPPNIIDYHKSYFKCSHCKGTLKEKTKKYAIIMKMVVEIHLNLNFVIKMKYGPDDRNDVDEGSFTPSIQDPHCTLLPSLASCLVVGKCASYLVAGKCNSTRKRFTSLENTKFHHFPPLPQPNPPFMFLLVPFPLLPSPATIV